MSRRTLHKLRNILHSAALILGMALIVGASAWILWGRDGVVWGLAGMALAMALSPSVPATYILSLYRARPLERAEIPEIHAAIDVLSRRAGLPAPPRLYYLPSAMLNAFAVGNRRSAAIGLTDGILRSLTFRELVGVLAHEISHVANNDLWTMNLADAMSRATTLMSYLGTFLLILNLPLIAAGMVMVPWPLVLVLMFAPTAMSLLQLALSRSREYEADLDAVALVGEPDGLASALAKLERRQGRLWEGVLLPGQRVPAPSLLRTHPPTEERIRRIMALRRPPPERTLPGPGQHAAAIPRGIAPVVTRPHYRWHGLWY